MAAGTDPESRLRKFTPERRARLLRVRRIATRLQEEAEEQGYVSLHNVSAEEAEDILDELALREEEEEGMDDGE